MSCLGQLRTPLRNQWWCKGSDLLISCSLLLALREQPSLSPFALPVIATTDLNFIITQNHLLGRLRQYRTRNDRLWNRAQYPRSLLLHHLRERIWKWFHKLFGIFLRSHGSEDIRFYPNLKPETKVNLSKDICKRKLQIYLRCQKDYDLLCRKIITR